MKSPPNTAVVIFLAAFMMVGFVLTIASAKDNSRESAGEWVAPVRADQKENPFSINEKSLTLGKQVYIRQCRTCHGMDGKGGPAAKGLERPVGNLQDIRTQGQSDGALFWKVTEGKKPMPKFEKTLTEEERWAVINYIRTLASSNK